MEGLLLVAAIFVVPCLPVCFQALDAVTAMHLVEPAELEEVPGRLDLVCLGQLRGDGKVDAVGGCLLLPGLAGAKLVDLDVVRGEVAAVVVLTVAQHLGIVGEALTVVLIEVDDPPLVAVVLGEPDIGGVIHAEVPRGVDRQALLVGDDGDAVLPVDALKLVGEICPLQARLEGLVEGRGVLAFHVGSLEFPLEVIPGFLSFGQGNALARFDGAEVYVHGLGDDDVFRIDAVLGVVVPGEEKKPPFEGGELAAPHAALVGIGAVVVKVAGLAFSRRLDGDDLSRVDRVQRSGDNLLCLVRVLRADLAELRYVQKLQRRTAKRGADTDRAVVAKR